MTQKFSDKNVGLCVVEKTTFYPNMTQEHRGNISSLSGVAQYNASQN